VASNEPITVSAGVLIRVVEFCRRRGHDPEVLCRRAGLSYNLLLDKRERLPLPLVERLCLGALELTGDPHFGLHLAQDVEDARNYDVGVLVLMASATLDEAMQRLARSTRYWGDGERVSFQRVSGGLSIRSLLPGPSGPFARHSHECALAELALGANALCGHPVRPEVVRFEHPAPDDLSEHRRVFDCRHEFSADHNGLVFDAAALRTPMRHANEAFLAVFEQQLNEALARLPESARTSDAVRGVARVALCNGGTSVAQIARLLSLSERTLQRRLQQEGTSFAEILDSTRREMATAYLRRGLALPEVSDLLGYSDTTAFHHAFRRWTGQSPTAYVGAATVAVDERQNPDGSRQP
jgi:AraC-like DNA-binding protein